MASLKSVFRIVAISKRPKIFTSRFIPFLVNFQNSFMSSLLKKKKSPFSSKSHKWYKVICIPIPSLSHIQYTLSVINLASHYQRDVSCFKDKALSFTWLYLSGVNIPSTRQSTWFLSFDWLEFQFPSLNIPEPARLYLYWTIKLHYITLNVLITFH